MRFLLKILRVLVVGEEEDVRVRFLLTILRVLFVGEE
jgi:hypothetical protein